MNIQREQGQACLLGEAWPILTIINTKEIVMRSVATDTTLWPAAMASAMELAVYATIIRLNIMMKKAPTSFFSPEKEKKQSVPLPRVFGLSVVQITP